MTKTLKKINFGTGIFLPEKILDNNELESRNIILKSGRQLTASGILEKIGVERRHIAGDDQTVADMATLAAKEALGGRIDIDLLIVSTSHPTSYHSAGAVAKNLGLKNAEILDVHAACSGSALMFAYLWENKKKLEGKNVLLIASEKFSDHVVDLTRQDSLDIDSSLGQTIFGDGAAALQFALGQDIEVLYAYNKDLPDKNGKTDLILMAMGENKFIEPSIIYPMACSGMSRDFPQGYFTQNGPRVYEAILNNIPVIIRHAVKKAGLVAGEIDLVIMHPGSKRLVEGLSGQLAPDFKTYSDYKDGNMSSVSLLYSFIKALREGLIGKGSRVVLSGFGAGSPHLYSSTVVIEIR